MGQGGQGKVFAVPHQPQVVAKIYNAPPDRQQQRKIKLLPQLATGPLRKVSAWPIAPITIPGGDVIGFTMPRVELSGAHQIHELTGEDSRRKHYPDADWKFLTLAARNLAASFATIHEHNHVIGDVNPNNIYVTRKATVQIIDVDSFQITHKGESFLCGVGMLEFTPPELQGQALTSVVRTQNHDNFGLATFIFQLIVGMGAYPYAGVYRNGQDFSMGDAIRQHHFAWSRRAHAIGLEPPPRRPALSIVPNAIADMFEAAFGPQRQRPTAAQWTHALQDLHASLVPCERNSTHARVRGEICPWCALERQSKRVYFSARTTPPAVQVPTAIPSKPPSTTEVERAWQQVSSLAVVPAGTLTLPALAIPVTPAVIGRRRRAVIGATVAALAGLAVLLIHFPVVLTALCWVLAMALFNGRHSLGNPTTLAEIKALDTQVQQLVMKQQQSSAGLTRSQSLTQELQVIYDQLRNPQKLTQQREADARRKYNAYLEAKFLLRHTISPGVISGVAEKRVESLKRYGVHTAYDVQYDRVVAVPGISTKIASDLVNWRNRLAQSMPPQTSTLPASLRAAVQVTVTAEQNQLYQNLLHGLSALQVARTHEESEYQQTRAQLEGLLKQREALIQQL